MARTKPRKPQDHLTAEEKAAAAERCARRRAGIIKAARMLSPQETVKQPARVPSETEEDSETEPEEDTFTRPDPAQIIKLSAVVRGSGGRFQWRGRLRGGGESVCLEGTWVRRNFKAYVRMARTLASASPPLTPALNLCFSRYFLESVQVAGGRFMHIPTGNARLQQQVAPAGLGGHWDGPEVLSAPGTSASAEVISTAECPVVAYRQGAADFCAAYGLASAMHVYGDAPGAAAVAACARAALASRDAFGHVTTAVRTAAAGWSSTPITGHDPLKTNIDTPVNLQLVGSDGAGTHAVATLGGCIFDAAEARALPLSRASLDHCVGAQLNGARFSHVARAVRLVPGKSLSKRLRSASDVVTSDLMR